MLLGCYAKYKSDLPANSSQLQLVWGDEFERDGMPDPSLWSYDVGNGCDLPCGCGWGNNELQYYTKANSKNARVKNNYLTIEAHREGVEKQKYTSARLISLKKHPIKYGRIEISAKLPSGVGTWPAIWMLPVSDTYGGWPASGEIDIMEHVGYVKDSIYGTVHTEAFNHMIGTQQSGEIYVPDAETTFHKYVIEWTENEINWYVNDMNYHVFRKERNDYKAWPFDQNFYLIMNLAVGGNWGGKKGVDENIFPQKMLVDYVRVYSKIPHKE